MIDARTEELASLYVLDALSDEERKAFAAQMAESAELRALVGELASGLNGAFKQTAGPERMDLLAGIHEKLQLEDPPIEASGNGEKRLSVPWTYVWAAAASLLLVMNLLLVFIVSNQSSINIRNVMARVSSSGAVQEQAASRSLTETSANPVLEARISRLRSQLSAQEAELRKLLDSRSALEAENREVRQFNAGWQREYMHLAARVLPFFEDNDGLSRFTVIEMVDVQAFDNQQPRLGFADLAGSFLTGEGNIAGVGSADFVGPIVEGAGLAAAQTSTGEGALIPSQQPEGLAQSMDLPDYTPPVEAETAMVGSTEAAMGFSVWRDDEQKGFLDIYNLPAPAEGQDPFLWVRASELDAYIPVGYLPELDNGTGSFFYSVDEAKFTPTEILITAEDTFEPGTEPSGEILLLGP
jgi:hypothetical protein